MLKSEIQVVLLNLLRTFFVSKLSEMLIEELAVLDHVVRMYVQTIESQ
jgi:hypothetical protein